jgi:predicted dehydrogenase/threonine dehydrogenase-like Zn-dependent dehydrogenase
MPLGYSSAGRVIEVGPGVDELALKDRVACIGFESASHAEVVFTPKNLCVKIPGNVSFEEASFSALGAIALHGIRTGRPQIGERAVVIGLGLLGQIAIQILKASGLKVMGADIDKQKVKLANDLGADQVVTIGIDDAARKARSFTNGIGADIVYIFASTYSNQPIELAGEIARDRGRVVVVGEITVNVPRKIYYEKELKLFISRSFGPGIYDPQYEKKGTDYPISYVRWTEKRNAEEFLMLVSEKLVKLESLITHRFKIQDALTAYDMILGKTAEQCIGVILEYGQEEKISNAVGDRVVNLRRAEFPKISGQELINIGLIGAGLHSKGVILPTLKRIKGINLLGVADVQGLKARDSGARYGFEYTTSDYQKILDDKNINTVIIATPHNLHASMLVDAIKAKKNIFIEKPLALNVAELKEIAKNYQKLPARVMVGFNRRFSPFCIKAKEFLEFYDGPRVISCRVNTGYIPKDHWVHDPAVGGGNIIGEACHFIDLIQFFSGSLPNQVYAQAISGNVNENVANDNIAAVIKMQNGSTASLVYTALGTRSYPREKIEIFGGEAAASIDNFRSLICVKDGAKISKNSFGIDKGYYGEFTAFFEAIRQGQELPQKFSDYLYTSLTAFMMAESCKSGLPYSVNISDLDA